MDPEPTAQMQEERGRFGLDIEEYRGHDIVTQDDLQGCILVTVEAPRGYGEEWSFNTPEEAKRYIDRNIEDAQPLGDTLRRPWR